MGAYIIYRLELVGKIDDCLNLNKAYQGCFLKIKEKIKENENEPQFEFSENYIFGRYIFFIVYIYLLLFLKPLTHL